MKQIRVIGIGSGCTNVLNRIIFNKQMKEKLTDCNITFGAIDSDKQLLDLSSADDKLLIINSQDDEGFTGNFEDAEKTAMTYENEIKTIIGNPDILIVISTIGGGTGTGIMPLVVKLAHEKGIKTVPIISIPFLWEGKKRINAANITLEKINEYVQDTIVINYEKILAKTEKQVTVKEAFEIADNVIIAKTEEIKYKFGKGFNI